MCGVMVLGESYGVCCVSDALWGMILYYYIPIIIRCDTLYAEYVHV